MSEMHLKLVSSLNTVGCSYVGFQVLLWKLTFCLGMMEFDCCGTQELLSEVENDGDEVENDADGDFVSVNIKTPVKKKKLLLAKGERESPYLRQPISM